jgi:uncharacterized protein
MSTLKTDILFTLGDPGRNLRDWPDYLQYGFEQSDVPALIELVADKSLHSAAHDSLEIWVPLHAWRTLGQLRSESAVMPLIGLFDELVEDDWALGELPEVMGMIGFSALAPLGSYVLEQDHDEFARVMALHGLCETAQRHPDQRGDVLACYKNYLQQPDTSKPTLNGLLVAYLLDLDAKELIDDIRSLFARECVDISCAGDLEEVEIELGLRSERSTPKPRLYDHLGFDRLDLDSLDLNSLDIGALPRPDGDDVIELLEYYLDHHGNDHSVLDVSELDGYFAALACAPHMIMPSVWMPGLWGGEERSPRWESVEDLQEFNQLIMTFYNYVMAGMNEGEHEAMFMMREVDDQSYTIVDEWCEGFLRGIKLWGPISATDAIAVEKALEPIRLFATERGFERLDKLKDDEVEQHQQAIEPAVRELFLHFFERRKEQGQPIVKAGPKVGRNDPCICGSGKKYKQCCLH